VTQNYLKGEKSPRINAFLAATGWNLRKLMVKLKKELKNLLDFIFFKSFKLELKVLLLN